MDASSPEHNIPKPEIVVGLDEKFQLFNLFKVNKEIYADEVLEGAPHTEVGFSDLIPYTFSKIILSTNLLPDVRFNPDIDHFATGLTDQTIVPFESEKGYEITEEDFDLAKRKLKARKFLEGLRTSETPPGHFVLFREPNAIDQNGLNVNREIIEMLRFQIFLPGASLESKLTFDYDEPKKHFWFSNFYPLERGPLPEGEVTLTNGTVIHLPETFDLILPIHAPSKLRQIQARFVVKKEEVPQAYKSAFKV